MAPWPSLGQYMFSIDKRIDIGRRNILHPTRSLSSSTTATVSATLERTHATITNTYTANSINTNNSSTIYQVPAADKDDPERSVLDYWRSIFISCLLQKVEDYPPLEVVFCMLPSCDDHERLSCLRSTWWNISYHEMPWSITIRSPCQSQSSRLDDGL